MKKCKKELAPERIVKNRRKTFRRLSINLLITQVLLLAVMVPLVWAIIVDPAPQIIIASAVAIALQFMVLRQYATMRRFALIVNQMRAEMTEIRGERCIPVTFPEASKTDGTVILNEVVDVSF